jgi:WD40 repeat protein
VKTFSGHAGTVASAAFSCDGRWVATAGPATVGVWEAGPSTLVDSRLYFLPGPDKPLTDVAFAATGWRLVAGSADGSAWVADCTLCGTTDRLVAVAEKKLERLRRDLAR